MNPLFSYLLLGGTSLAPVEGWSVDVLEEGRTLLVNAEGVTRRVDAAEVAPGALRVLREGDFVRGGQRDAQARAALEAAAEHARRVQVHNGTAGAGSFNLEDPLPGGLTRSGQR